MDMVEHATEESHMFTEESIDLPCEDVLPTLHRKNITGSSKAVKCYTGHSNTKYDTSQYMQMIISVNNHLSPTLPAT